METLLIFQRYSSQRLEVANTVEVVLVGVGDEGLLGGCDNLAHTIQGFVSKKDCAVLAKALNMPGAFVVQKVANGYKLEIRRITSFSNSTSSSKASGGGQEWVSSVVEWILRFCEYCATKPSWPRILFRSATFIVDNSLYFTYDIKN